jgi:hypothetical protein
MGGSAVTVTGPEETTPLLPDEAGEELEGGFAADDDPWDVGEDAAGPDEEAAPDEDPEPALRTGLCALGPGEPLPPARSQPIVPPRTTATARATAASPARFIASRRAAAGAAPELSSSQVRRYPGPQAYLTRPNQYEFDQIFS